MRIQIVGKAHRFGTSKKGKDYNFTEVHYLGKDRFVEGQACKTKLIDANVCDASRILVQQFYDIEFDENGNVVAIVPAKA